MNIFFERDWLYLAHDLTLPIAPAEKCRQVLALHRHEEEIRNLSKHRSANEAKYTFSVAHHSFRNAQMCWLASWTLLDVSSIRLLSIFIEAL